MVSTFLLDYICLIEIIPDASFSENFYGLKRILNNGDKLRGHYKNLSFIFIVVLPYFRRKLNEKHSIIQLENADGLLQKVLIVMTGRFCLLLNNL